jgi:hypothetical protein
MTARPDRNVTVLRNYAINVGVATHIP